MSFRDDHPELFCTKLPKGRGKDGKLSRKQKTELTADRGKLVLLKRATDKQRGAAP